MLGALFTFILFAIIYYDCILIKKIHCVFENKRPSVFKFGEMLLFCLINFAAIWMIVSLTLGATVDRRTLSDSDNVIIALVVGLIFVCCILFTYRKHFPSIKLRLNKPSMHKPTFVQSTGNKSETTKFNYFYAFKYIPGALENYRQKKSNILTVLDVPSIILAHPEYSKIAPKIQYAFSENKQDKNIKVLAISIPNNKAIADVEIAYIVYNDSNNTAAYFTLEYSLEGYAIAKPTSDGKHQLIDFVDSPDKFVEKVLSIAYDELSEIKKDEHHRNNKITEQNNVYVTTDNQTIQTIMSCVVIFSNEYAFQLKLPSYTRREVMLFASAVNLGGKKIQLLKTQQGSSFLQRLYSLFVGNEAPRSIIDSMQGMSVPCMFADSLHITQRLSDMLQGCTSVSFEDVQCKGKPIRMLKLLRSLIFFTNVHLSEELKSISLQEIFDRKDELFVNETCERTAPAAICTPIEQWPILESINRAEFGYRQFIIDYIIERIEQYYSVYSSLGDNTSYNKLAKAIITEAFNVDHISVFTYCDYECAPLQEVEFTVFKEAINRVIFAAK